MGVGGSFLMPSTLSILITVFDDEERRTAIAAWSAVAMVGVIAGPTLGGFLLEHFYWGSVFLLNIPIAVVAIVAAFALMPESRAPARRIDPVGVLLSVVGMTALVWAVITAPAEGWAAPGTLAAGGVALVALGLFAAWELRSDHPMLPLRLFRNRSFSGASFSILLLSFGSGALLLALTQYLQFVQGYGVMQAGLALIPYAASAAVFNGVGAGLGRKVSNRTLITAGMTVIAGGFAIFALLEAGSSYGLLLASFLVMGMGAGLAGPAAYTTLMGAVPPAHAGVGSALNDTVQQVGAALSVAVLGSVLAGMYTASMPAAAPEAARDSISGALALGDPALAAAARSAFTDAMSVGGWVGAVLSLAGAVVALLVIRPGAPVAAQPDPEAVKV
jgi:MFS family permease